MALIVGKPVAGQTLTVTDGKTATYNIVIKQVSEDDGGGGIIIIPPNPTKSDPTIVVSNGTASTNIRLELNSDTNTAEAEIDETTFRDILENMGTDGMLPKTLTIDVPHVDDVTAYKLTIPSSTVNSTEAGKETVVKTEIATVAVPSNMLLPETTLESDKVSLIISKGDKTELSAELQAEIGDKPLIQLELQINGKRLDWENKKAPVEIAVPYQPTQAELADPEHITVWYIDGEGNVIPVSNGRYDPETGMVTFSVTHFSQYAVFVKRPLMILIDLAGPKTD